MHYSRTVHALFMHLKILKMNPTTIFTHLKIILLQYFQFLVFNFSKNKLYPNGPLVDHVFKLYFLIASRG